MGAIRSVPVRPRTALVVACWCLGLVEAWVLHVAHGPRVGASLVVTAAAVAALLAGRGAVVPAGAVVLAAWTVPALVAETMDSLALLLLTLVVVFAAGETAHLGASLLSTTLAFAGAVVAAAVAGGPLVDDLWTLAIVGAVWLAGSVVQRHQAARLDAETAVVEVAEASGERVREAVLAERSRLARDLHDVISHGVAAMTVQAGAAARVIDTRPDDAREALTEIQRAGARTIEELRRLLLVLHDADEAASAQPEDWEQLLGRARSLGLTVRCSGVPDGLPAGQRRTLQRALQESLVNARRHGGECAVDVHVARDAQQVTLTVRNDCGPGATGPGTGHGLLGLRDRITMYGGTLAAGPDDRGGWQVEVSLPAGAP